MIPWHRLLGLMLEDLFLDSPFEVEVELDLSKKQQFLDVVIIRKTEGEFDGILPDGLENLSAHNLITYKSFRESLDKWALQELIAHYVGYRKLRSDSKLHADTDFKLFAVCTRYPQGLAAQVELESITKGVYRFNFALKSITLIVLSQVNQSVHNAVWQLFSGVGSQVAFGASHYQRHSNNWSTILEELFAFYNLEGVDMPYTIEDLKRDVQTRLLESMTPEELDEFINRFGKNKLLEGFSVEERLQGLNPKERLQGLNPEERLQGLNPEDIKAYLEKLA